MRSRINLSFLFLLVTQVSIAASAPDQDQLDIEASIAMLDKINYLPNLLPVILNNKDFIGLTEEQVGKLEDWRRENRQPMPAAMKQIAVKHVEIKQAALTPSISSARLQQMQNDIFRLQRQILEYKLSCRDHVLRTFNDENWDSFYMVLEDEDIGVSLQVIFAEK
jgi:hypothetical protein